MITNLFDFKIKNNVKFFCNNDELCSQFLLYLLKENNGDILLVTSNLIEANRIYNSLINYSEDVYLFLEDDYLSKKALATSPEFLLNRLNLLNNYSNKNKKIIICNLNAFVKELPNKNEYISFRIKISKNSKIDSLKFQKQLIDIGYKKESIVTEAGEFAARGFVIDVFPYNYENPIRIELFDEDVECIKYFDFKTQRSIVETEDNIEIYPIKDELNAANDSYIVDYLNNHLVVFYDYNQLIAAEKNINEQKRFYSDKKLIDFEKINVNKTLYLNRIDNNADYMLCAEDISNEVNSLESLKNYINENKNCVIVSKNKNFLKKIEFKYKVIDPFNLNKSFKYNNFSYISLNDVFHVEEKKSYSSKIRLGSKISSLNNLNVGDYVVHKEHGIGIYEGIKTIEKNNVKKDYILIQYKGNDKLYIPAQNLKNIYKYSSKDGSKPKIYKLNSKDWEKTKYRIKNKAKDISEKLIKIYKERNKVKIKPYDVDSPEQLIFENEFSYEPTPDQITVSNEIKKDMEKTRPMERLLCGDVGYGKTEVIFRAIFKSIMNNKQVCYLCPTTLLATQQYNSAIKRFSNHAIKIELLTRHTTSKEVKRIIEDLKTGKTDVIFGTHKLLNKDIKYKSLGLLVIDEEHRFGVEHKEKIKDLTKEVNVLSVSATPIPRSLQMSLVGIRDMSLIETPPHNRYPIQTYVINYDELLLREAINKEISRGGQVFIIYNNIEKMIKFSNKVQNMFTGLKVSYAHGKMNKTEINEIMESFVNRKSEILISTTIIENGIDIPNANTIIVIDADHFGLSQLYQIRGRVGRSDKIAYAYLMYDNSKILNESAKKRLEAIKEFTTLGSGYKISMRDLSIRGAGDLLGREQAGYIDSVGVDMYLELINEELNNYQEESSEEKEINFDEVETHINNIYTESDELIIELHNKISNITDEKKYEEVYNEILDRYGILDKKLEYYLKQELLEGFLNNLNIKISNNDKYKIILLLEESIFKKLNIEDFFVNISRISTKFNFKYQNNSILLSLNKLGLGLEYIDYLIEVMKYVSKKVT